MDVENSRSGDDDLGILKLLVKGRVLAVLVAGGDEGVALILKPLANTKLVLDGSEKLGDLMSRVLSAIVAFDAFPVWYFRVSLSYVHDESR